METIILTKENLLEIITKLTELVNNKKYWLGVGMGRFTSAEDPAMEWFRGVGTFERIAYLQIGENHHGHGIQIYHINAVDSSSVVPQDDVIRYGAEIFINGNDLLYYEDNKHISTEGGTCVYMEWTRERNEKYGDDDDDNCPGLTVLREFNTKDEFGNIGTGHYGSNDSVTNDFDNRD